ncbi:MAG: hypothetical protein ACKOWG_14650 [Planctomycetia bacterium]
MAEGGKVIGSSTLWPRGVSITIEHAQTLERLRPGARSRAVMRM